MVSPAGVRDSLEGSEYRIHEQQLRGIPEVAYVVGGPGQPDPGAAQHVDEVGDTQDVLRCLESRVPTAQDQHILTLKVLGVHGHGLVTFHVFRAGEVNQVGD